MGPTVHVKGMVMRHHIVFFRTEQDLQHFLNNVVGLLPVTLTHYHNSPELKDFFAILQSEYPLQPEQGIYEMYHHDCYPLYSDWNHPEFKKERYGLMDSQLASKTTPEEFLNLCELSRREE